MSAHARILIVDDHYVVRQGVRSILTARPEWEICGEASNGQEALQAAMAQRPDVIIMDITMPGMNGLDASGRIAGMNIGASVLVLTMHDFQPLTKDIRRAGAKGYVQKARAGRDLIQAIETLLDGGTFFETQLKPEPTRHSESGHGFGQVLELRRA